MVSEQERPLKKPYGKPILRVYGDIKSLTRTVGHKGQLDSAPVKGMSLKTG